ncbi:response regulator [Segetibacter sp. 3557_3]|nr:response regulator [Segetibacter sp. 3557_3]
MGKTILIIDDDSRNIFALSAVLRAKGFHCLTATGITEAFSCLNSGDPIAVILMDMMMPEMDGYEAIPKIRSFEQWKNIPIIAVTAQAMSGDKEKCLLAGADGYVSKPVDINLLMDIIAQFI